MVVVVGETESNQTKHRSVIPPVFVGCRHRRRRRRRRRCVVGGGMNQIETKRNETQQNETKRNAAPFVRPSFRRRRPPNKQRTLEECASNYTHTVYLQRERTVIFTQRAG